jgi:hypothetical protein
MKTSAMVELNPGMLIGSSRAGRKGAIHYSILALGASMSVVWALNRCRYSSVLTRWWLVNRPGSASINSGFFERILPKCRVYPVAVPGVMMEKDPEESRSVMVDRDVLRQMTVAVAVGGGFLVGVSGDYGDAAAGPSLVVPANYAFGIWAPIYAGLFSHAVYQALPARRRDPVLRRTGWATACAVGLSGFWVWAQDNTGLELSLIAVTVAASVTGYVRAAPVQKSEVASACDRWLVRAPLGLFSGWITVATVAGGGEALLAAGISAPGAEAWSTAALLAAGAVGSTVAWLRPVSLAYATAVTWGLAGVAVRILPQHPVPGAAALLAGVAVAAAGVAGARRRRTARIERQAGTGTAAQTS